jgi:hypothetical protein
MDGSMDYVLLPAGFEGGMRAGGFICQLTAACLTHCAAFASDKNVWTKRDGIEMIVSKKVEDVDHWLLTNSMRSAIYIYVLWSNEYGMLVDWVRDRQMFPRAGQSPYEPLLFLREVTDSLKAKRRKDGM